MQNALHSSWNHLWLLGDLVHVYVEQMVGLRGSRVQSGCPTPRALAKQDLETDLVGKGQLSSKVCPARGAKKAWPA